MKFALGDDAGDADSGDNETDDADPQDFCDAQSPVNLMSFAESLSLINKEHIWIEHHRPDKTTPPPRIAA